MCSGSELVEVFAGLIIYRFGGPIVIDSFSQIKFKWHHMKANYSL